MITRVQIILLLVLLSQTLLYSHNNINMEEPHILYRLNFEERNPLPTFISAQTATAYGLQIVESPVFEGKKAARFELRSGDNENNNGTRAEISFPEPGGTGNIERWYAFAIYFPRKEYDTDSSDEVISQWHQGGKATPSLCMRTKNGRLRLRITARPKDKDVVEMGPIEKDVWQYFVVHVKHSATADGLVEIWRNGVPLVNYKGANMYDLSTGNFHLPNWKLGIYKSAWNKGAVTDASKRVLYFDAISVGNERASFAEMNITKTSNRK
ncbi:MAG TPA: polysaccharide lyase [Niastella sp.]